MKPPFHLSTNVGLFSAVCVLEIQTKLQKCLKLKRFQPISQSRIWYFFKASQLFRSTDGQAVGILLFLLFIVRMIIHCSLLLGFLVSVFGVICQSFITEDTLSLWHLSQAGQFCCPCCVDAERRCGVTLPKLMENVCVKELDLSLMA